MNILCVLYHEANELDVVGVYNALVTGRRFLTEPKNLGVYTVAKSRNSVQTSGGLTITPHWAFLSAPEPDILVIPGGAGVDAAKRDKPLMTYLRERTPNARLVASVCTGALLLGELGLVRDQRATTHADRRDMLLDYEAGEIVDARVVKNPRVYFAGGVTAGIDLGLELLHDFFSAEVAAKTAQSLNYPLWQAIANARE